MGHVTKLRRGPDRRTAKTYAETMVDVLNDLGMVHAVWGIPEPLEECYRRKHPDALGGGTWPHPLVVFKIVLNSLARRPDLFDRHYIRGHDNSGRSRIVRGYKLREEHRRH